jgi:putative DNA primase/helicase
MGDYHKVTPMETFLKSHHDRHPTEIADLCGARLVTAVETDEGRSWDEAKTD